MCQPWLTRASLFENKAPYFWEGLHLSRLIVPHVEHPANFLLPFRQQQGKMFPQKTLEEQTFIVQPAGSPITLQSTMRMLYIWPGWLLSC